MMEQTTRPIAKIPASLRESEKFTVVRQMLLPLAKDIAPTQSSLIAPKELSSNIGRVIGNAYHLEEFLGRGGMGSVYLATDIHDNSQAAVKLTSRYIDGWECAHLVKAAKFLSGIHHENVVSIKTAGIFEEGAYIVMEYMKGEDLDKRIGREGILSWESTKRIIAQVCSGLGALHSYGVVHGDVKPPNIFVTRSGIVKVFDFDMSKFILFQEETKDIKTGAYLRGTPAYVSPEQAMGHTIDNRSDIYSTGIVLYEMACGSTPFKGITALDTMLMHIDKVPLPPSARNPYSRFPASVEGIVMKALEKDPDARFQSMDEMRTAIQEAT